MHPLKSQNKLKCENVIVRTPNQKQIENGMRLKIEKKKTKRQPDSKISNQEQ